jgi:MFS family permease
VTLISACFVCVSFVYTSAIIYSTGIIGNKYLNYSVLQLVAVPTRIVTAVTLNRFGRKAPICVAYCLCGVCFIASTFVPLCESLVIINLLNNCNLEQSKRSEKSRMYGLLLNPSR